MRRLLLAVLVTLVVVPDASAALRAGAARVDITPVNGGSTLGFVRPDVAVKGVHTRLTGRVLVLADGDSRVALLATDLGYALEKDSIVARVADLGYTHDQILYTTSHTHAGPDALSGWQVQQLADGIRRATERLRPARAAWADGSVAGVNRNRSIEAHLANHGLDQFYGQGRVEDDPRGEDHTVDERLRVLRVDGTDRRPIAAWMVYPVHLTTSTPTVDVWDADLAAPAELHLERAVRRDGFVTLFNNGSLGDLMPRFDSYNPSAVMDLHGLRIAERAWKVWKGAGRHLSADVPVDVRWTRACYCGQELEPGRSVSDAPVWGLPFLGGSEDGASIFKEPVATEGRRLPAEAAHPVHGRKIVAAPGIVHESTPEVHAIRIGERVLLGAPGEPSVEMGRRFEAAVKGRLPAGVLDAFVVALANDYIGYMVTPEEYEMQHYEGGHTVFGVWTSLLVRNTFERLVDALREGAAAPAPDKPAELGPLGGTGGRPGASGAAGALTEEPVEAAERMQTVSIAWTGAPGGADRPVDAPFLTLERSAGDGWRAVDDDLGLSFVWREADGAHTARYDLAARLRTGRYRLRVTSGSYELASRPFAVAASDDLQVRGVRARRLSGRRTRLVVVAQNPAPDPATAIRWRPQSPNGGRAVLRVRGRRVVARWSWKRGGWVAVVRSRVPAGTPIAVRSLRDRWGNRAPAPVTLPAGEIAELEWPPNMGVGGGRTPGPFGQGSFPP
jgi:neutral ceramidase